MAYKIPQVLINRIKMTSCWLGEPVERFTTKGPRIIKPTCILTRFDKYLLFRILTAIQWLGLAQKRAHSGPNLTRYYARSTWPLSLDNQLPSYIYGRIIHDEDTLHTTHLSTKTQL